MTYASKNVNEHDMTYDEMCVYFNNIDEMVSLYAYHYEFETTEIEYRCMIKLVDLYNIVLSNDCDDVEDSFNDVVVGVFDNIYIKHGGHINGDKYRHPDDEFDVRYVISIDESDLELFDTQINLQPRFIHLPLVII